MNDNKILYSDLSYDIIGFAIQVRKELGFGFLEKVYENALMVLLRENGIEAVQQYELEVRFRGQKVGIYKPDILVEDKIILELKSLDRISKTERAQALNYLKATGMRLAIILNFGKTRLEQERLVM